jgi:hypothetical protein
MKTKKIQSLLLIIATTLTVVLTALLLILDSIVLKILLLFSSGISAYFSIDLSNEFAKHTSHSNRAPHGYDPFEDIEVQKKKKL